MSPRPLALLIALAIAAPLAAQEAPGAPLLNGKHTLNLKDADVRTFISTVSEITGTNFIVDPRVEGKVNIISTQPMDKDEVYRVFESVLRVHGYALVPAGDVVKVLPEAIAVQDGAASSPVRGPDSLTTRVIPLKYVSPNALLTVLRPLIPQSGQIVASPSGNAIIVTDRAGNVARIENIIGRIDTASDSSVEAIPLQHANAQEVASTLNKLGGSESNGSKPAMVVADARTNSILLSGDSGARLKARAMITHLDTPLDAGESTQVVYLRYANAELLVPVLDSVAATLTGGSTAKDASRVATIQSHQDTNALIITAAPAVFRSLQGVIRNLDVRRAQVLIEAMIAEVSDETAREIGIQWQATDGLSQEGLIGGTNFPTTGNAGIVDALRNPLGALGAGLNLGYITGTTTIGEGDGATTVYEIGALAKLLRGDSRTNILSEPSIVTLDNKEATIKVGQEVPFLTGQYTNSSTTGGSSQPTNPFQTIERKDVGITLKVTPHINEGDEVMLDLSQVVSSLAPSVDGASDLITNNREISTSVLVKDGGMLVLGGLTTHETSESISKVPALGDIPLLGNLFKYRKTNMVRRNLMIFLRPRILRDANQEAIISQEKYNFLRAEQLRVNALPGNTTPERDQPLLQVAPTSALEE
ncbi:MAG: type II secretion system secretin GspD [Xanthomonadales bacterium]|nr:type II secretion system secretin GspD [Xanthomonadales bacterium]